MSNYKIFGSRLGVMEISHFHEPERPYFAICMSYTAYYYFKFIDSKPIITGGASVKNAGTKHSYDCQEQAWSSLVGKVQRNVELFGKPEIFCRFDTKESRKLKCLILDKVNEKNENS